MIKNKKGALEFSFAWIFAIVAGVLILLLAIYGVVKFINLNKTEISAQTAKGITVLLNPLESAFEESARKPMVLPIETRIYTTCENDTFESVFGKQTIRTSQKLSNEWSNEEVNVPFYNRYVFSKNPAQGKRFYLFSKSVEIPFKIADLIYVISTDDKYCFVNPPGDIEDEIEGLIGETPKEYENFILENRKSDCPDGSTTVCFSGECDIYVSRNSNSAGRITKSSETTWYEGDALMYAAIFSSKKDYECQVDRLMSRAEQLYELYWDKAEFLSSQRDICSPPLRAEIIRMLDLLRHFQDSEDLSVIYDMAEEIETKNNANNECRLWY